MNLKGGIYIIYLILQISQQISYQQYQIVISKKLGNYQVIPYVEDPENKVHYVVPSSTIIYKGEKELKFVLYINRISQRKYDI